ncbi:tetratricopeptide repeat protein [Sessilibacter sp. MAH4]
MNNHQTQSKRSSFLTLIVTAVFTLSSLEGHSALSPSFEADRLLIEAEDLISQSQFSKAKESLSRSLSLRTDPPPRFYFLQGRVYAALNEPHKALSSYESYIEHAGRSAPEYFETLRLITKLREQTQGPSKTVADDSLKASTAKIKWSNDLDVVDDYYQYLEFLYQTDDTVKAVTQHINNLLEFYGYGETSVVASNKLEGAHRHKISVKLPDTVITTTQNLANTKRLTTNQRFSVYGVDPYLRYECGLENASCQLLNPTDGSTWLEIIDNQPAAEELSRAISSLVRLLQKQS